MEISLREVIRRGLGHTLNCEDEALSVVFDDKLIIMATFDGCSTGTKSHFASALLGKIFNKILVQDESYYKESVGQISLEEICKYTIRRVFLELKHISNYLELVPKEALATIVMGAVDLQKKEVHTLMIGDGSVYVDGELHSIDCPENKPQYLAYFLHYENFVDVWRDALVFSQTQSFNNTVAVMTDGIDSFFNKQANRYIDDAEKEKVVEMLLKSDRFLKNPVGLARICNILQMNNKFEPNDDLAIVRLTFLSPIDDSI